MILIAAYSTKHYGRFAFNLAHSIKVKNDIPICLLTDGKTGIDTTIFDVVKEIDTPTDPCLFKININKYTPFEETLYLDADMVCMNEIQPLIDRLKGSDIWVDTLRNNESFWLKSEAFDKPYQDTNTSIIYFSNKSDEYFGRLNELYETIDRSLFKNFWGKANFIPDEALHSLALSETETMLPIDSPVFYCDHSIPKQQILKRYFLSMYGARIAKQDTKDIYDSVMSSVMKKIGKSHEYKIDPLYRNKFIAL